MSANSNWYIKTLKNVSKHQQHKRSPQIRENKMRKHREVRDLVSLLRKKYAPAVVEDFIANNYFISIEGIYFALKKADDKPVDRATASIAYTTATHPDFKL